MGRCTGTIAITICQFIVSPTPHQTKKKKHICVFLPLTLCLNPCWCIFRAVFCASLCPLYLFTIFAWAPFNSCFFFFVYLLIYNLYMLGRTCSHTVRMRYICHRVCVVIIAVIIGIFIWLRLRIRPSSAGRPLPSATMSMPSIIGSSIFM